MGRLKRTWILIAVAALLTGCSAPAEDKGQVQKLEQEIVRLEAKVKELEAAAKDKTNVTPAPVTQAAATVQNNTTVSTQPSLLQGEKIAVKQTITIPDIMEFSIDSIQWSDKIVPSDTSSFYSYMEDQSGETYLVLKGEVTNLSGDTLDPEDYQESVLRINDKYNFFVGWEVEDQDGTGFYGYVKPLQKGKLVLYASVTDAVRTQMETGVLTLNVLSDAKRLGYFFDSKDDAHRTFRMEVKP